MDIPSGRAHCATSGDGPPVLLLHQTPRSWDEYRDVIPLLARHRRAIAMDTLGYGDSSCLPPGEASIERWAAVVVELLDALELPRADIVGHHTGGYIATEVAVATPERVRSVVLSGLSLHGAEKRNRLASGRAIVDDVDHTLDGSHLKELWAIRAAFYPADVDLLDRFMADCLRAGPMAAEGHRLVARYPTEERLPLVTRPCLLLMADGDQYSFPSLDRMREAVPHAAFHVIEGGMVPLPDQLPEAFAASVDDFLSTIDARS